MNKNRTYEIRKASLTDLGDIRQILLENGRSNPEEALSLLNDTVLKHDPELFIVEKNGQNAGFITMKKSGENLYEVDWLLKDEYKHGSLGTALTQMMCEYVLRRGCDCQMSFPASDVAKLSIVRKLGFTMKEGTLKHQTYVRKRDF